VNCAPKKADTFGSAPRSRAAAGNTLNNCLLSTYVRRSGIKTLAVDVLMAININNPYCN
jgi:hypothetical protein